MQRALTTGGPAVIEVVTEREHPYSGTAVDRLGGLPYAGIRRKEKRT